MKDLIEFKPNLKGFKIETPNGWEKFKGVAKYDSKYVYEIITESGFAFCGSSNHALIDKNGEPILIKNCLNKYVQTKNGLEKIISKKRKKGKHFVYDIVGVESKTFYSQGVLHHNTHILEEFWSSVIPSISSGKKSKILVVSTPNSTNNKFYEIFSGAENGTLPDWKASRIDWWDVPGRDEEWKRSMVAALGSEEKFSQEFGNCVEGSAQVHINNGSETKDYEMQDLYKFLQNSKERLVYNKQDLKVLTPWGLRSFEGIQKIKKSVIEFTTTNTKITVSHKHPFIVEGNVCFADSLKIGDSLEGESGKLQTITNITSTEKKQWVYDLVGVDGSCYFANGILVHNCFLDNNTAAVGSLIIEKFKREKKDPVWVSEDGEYTVFEFPVKGKLYVIGVDVGEGIGRAASVAQILDVTDLTEIKQVAIFSSNVTEPYHFANKLNTIGSSWGIAPMLIERNNCGAQVIDALHYKHSYQKIISYNKISESEKYNRTRNMGVLSHNNIRFDGIQNLRYWINHLQCVKINDPSTISEFETFVRHPNGVFRKRTENFFDDRIMALVWALFILEPEISEQYYTIEEYDNQHKPLKLASNGYWEETPDSFELKDLKKDSRVIHKPNEESLGVNMTDLYEMDKYDLDVDALKDIGYDFFNFNDPDV